MLTLSGHGTARRKGRPAATELARMWGRPADLLRPLLEEWSSPMIFRDQDPPANAPLQSLGRINRGIRRVSHAVERDQGLVSRNNAAASHRDTEVAPTVAHRRQHANRRTGGRHSCHQPPGSSFRGEDECRAASGAAMHSRRNLNNGFGLSIAVQVEQGCGIEKVRLLRKPFAELIPVLSEIELQEWPQHLFRRRSRMPRMGWDAGRDRR
jgi:hypothetical protein